MREHKTLQEQFWAGAFGDAYTDRNTFPQFVARKTALFARCLARAQGIRSVLELGANVGTNLVAINSLLPDATLHGVEINAKAYARLSTLPGVAATHGSLLAYEPPCQFDIVLTCGVLIHIAPDQLSTAYRKMYDASQRYILVAEYYNPTPVEVPYRGHADRLFKRDWAGELIDAYPGLVLIDYGFVYQRDPMFPLDDLTWFLLEKQRA